MEQKIRKFIRRAQGRSGNTNVERKARSIVSLPGKRMFIKFSQQVKMDTDSFKYYSNGQEVSAGMYTRKEWKKTPIVLKRTMI